MDGGTDIVVDHNTSLQSGNMITATYATALNPAPSFVFTNNILSYNLYGVFGDYGVGLGMTAINTYFPGASFVRNGIAGGLASNFPATTISRRRSPPSASSIWPGITTRSRPELPTSAPGPTARTSASTSPRWRRPWPRRRLRRPHQHRLRRPHLHRPRHPHLHQRRLRRPARLRHRATPPARVRAPPGSTS